MIRVYTSKAVLDERVRRMAAVPGRKDWNVQGNQIVQESIKKCV